MKQALKVGSWAGSWELGVWRVRVGGYSVV
jgi:hypothetical protein